MKSNILIIVGLIFAVLGVIALVIILSKPAESDTPYDYGYSSESTDDTSQNLYSSDNSTQSSSIGYSSSDVQSNAAKNIVSMACSLINTPYAEYGDSPAGFDNSGFIYYVMRKNGFLTCPRGIAAQSEWGSKESYARLTPGGLAFFFEDGGSTVSFGGIYIGGGEMVACISHDGVTKVWKIDITTDYYRKNFAWGIAIS